MPKLKTKKTFLKRFRITSQGKVMKRAVGQSHYNARATGEATMGKHRDRRMRPGHTNVIKRLL
ncbi:MAG: 50S ribosomal protein L35 [Patescibacteria group bacterium]